MVITRSQHRTPSPLPGFEPRGKGNGEHLTPVRVRVFKLRQELKYSAARTQKETGVPIRTQGYWLRSKSECRTDRTRPGRPTFIPDDTLDKIIKEFKGRHAIRRLDYHTMIHRHDLNVTVKTLRKALNDRGI
jgi:hypothetical protein